MKTFKIQTNFTGGEIDPRLKGRVDVPRYQNGVETLNNAHVLLTGGVTRRAGTRFVYDAGTNITVRLLPFNVFKTDVTPAVLQGYVIEFRSDNKIRFYTNGALIMNGGNPYEITSPFTGADLKKIRYTQANNVLYMVHPDFAPQQLVRTNDTSWAISSVFFTQPATPHWDATSGYPSVITFFEQRMIIGSTKARPQTLWGSASSDTFIWNLVTGTGDSDPFMLTLAAATSNILHVTADRQIMVFTYDKELTIQGGVEKPLTPTNKQAKEQTSYGIKESARPLAVGGELFFVTRSGKKIRSLTYQIDSEKYMATDTSFISGHLTEGGIEDMALSNEPDNLIYCIASDGRLFTFIFNKEQEVNAWSENSTDGFYKNLAIIPQNNTDQVWVAVQRTINGVTKTYVEYFDNTLNTDAAYTGYDAVGKTLWTGLSYLEGKTVDIVADGAAQEQQVVSNGQITLTSLANNVEIGVPYTTTIKDLSIEMATPLGSAQGQIISVNRVTARLYKSLGGEVGGQPLLPSFGTVQSGDKMLQSLGWDAQGVVTIEQKKPLPFTVLAILKEVVVNG